MPQTLGVKEHEIMTFLRERVLDPVIASPQASNRLKQGCRLTIVRMQQLDAEKMIQYYWSAIIGTERSVGFAAQLRKEGFARFEDQLEEFRLRFAAVATRK